jgi:hypothetical protein
MSEFTFELPPRIARCPHCGTGRPQVTEAQQPYRGGDRIWAVYMTTCCQGLLLAQGRVSATPGPTPIEAIYPSIHHPLGAVFPGGEREYRASICATAAHREGWWGLISTSPTMSWRRWCG